jgi:predicted RNA-binding protein with PIN domain
VSRLYLIDGYNLLHQIPELTQETLDLEGRREHLINRLISMTAGRGNKITVVFDGPRSTGSSEQRPGLKVIFAAPSADHYMRYVIAANTDRRDLVIVSSDRKDIGNYARICGIEWMTSTEFWEWLSSKMQLNQPRIDKVNERGAPPGWTARDDDDLINAFGDD